MNGEFMKAEDLKISPFDHGFLYGVGFFETFRTYAGDVFLFEEHMTRLRAALTEYRITMPYDDEKILVAVRTLDEKSGDADGYFRLNVSAGVHDIGLAPSSYTTPNVILFRKVLVPTVRGVEKKAVWLDTQRNRPESKVRHKSHNFLNNVRGRLELPSLKEVEGLFVTAEGFVAEGITSNVFWMKDGELYTPAIETGVLPGTTRAYLIRLAQSIGIDVNEGFYGKVDVENADELFASNAVQELVPLSGIGEISFPGASGVYYKKLHGLYVKAIERMKEGGH
ncbi:aminodeoxychorismate lyase [Sporosarcina limicola]|uniref:4-amino-4-deoxychorismate lyase n=1 Tax=Sporosarcina limicola TaxID=34101 RepID=A0A927MK93_9BACL|nr:aminodeoxychorismate lyase [Sporosarcina limicola]MBE1556148.1 4-amino-4-deoxychorismate lyase [Sporosarcina limicola]